MKTLYFFALIGTLVSSQMANAVTLAQIGCYNNQSITCTKTSDTTFSCTTDPAVSCEVTVMPGVEAPKPCAKNSDCPPKQKCKPSSGTCAG